MDDLTKDEIAQLAGESEEAIVERAQVKEKLSALEVGLQDLRNLETHHTLAALGMNYSHHLELFSGSASVYVFRVLGKSAIAI